MAESRSTTKREWSKAVGAIVVMVLMLLIFVGFVMLFGAVRGEEFSPTTFSRRSFVFYRIPLLKIQVTPVIRSSATGALETHLIKNVFAEVTSNDIESAVHAKGDNNGKKASTAQRWDVVRITPLSRPSEIGAAHCLGAYLDRLEGGKLKWLRWTKAHPKLAQALWPVVRQAAIDRLYFAVPDLMITAEQAARRGTLASELKIELEQITRQAANLRQRATSGSAGPSSPTEPIE